MTVFEKKAQLSRFDELASVVWRTQDMGSAEFREMARIAPSDFSATIPERHSASARHYVEAARTALMHKLGITD